jgi:hypothetical protein
MVLPDLSTLTIVQVFTLAIVIAVIDFGLGVITAVGKGTFNLGLISTWVESHGVHRLIPILIFLAIGHGLDPVLAPIPAAFAAGLAFLATYALETLSSIQQSFQNPIPPTDNTPKAQ